MPAEVFDASSALSLGLVLTLLGSVVSVMRTMQRRDAADSAKHHEHDKRLTILEQKIAARRDCASRSDVYRIEPYEIRERSRDD